MKFLNFKIPHSLSLLSPRRTYSFSSQKTQLNKHPLSRKTFFQSNTKDSLISHLCDQKRLREAVQLLSQIDQPPSASIYSNLIQLCVQHRALEEGKKVHAHTKASGFVPGVFICNRFLDMYVKCGSLRDAQKVFDEMPERDLCSWNTMISGYAKVGKLDEARNLFDEMPERDNFSWTAMISGYTQNGLAEQALYLFEEMLKEDSEVKPNWVTIMSVLPACAESSGLEHGRRIHDFANRIGLDLNASVLTALVAMYAKCGSLTDARQCFDRIREKNLVTWNTMITAYASHGCGMECVWTFEDMIREGIQPDTITFTGLLSGCGHSGLVDVGLKYFNCMNTEHSIKPRVEHYACVVDLLARVG